MEFQGNRISILNKENSLSVVIFSNRNRLKNILMLLWILTFTICGLMAIPEYTHAQDRDRKIFWLVFLSFWIYFELVVLKAFLWRLKGKEKVLLSQDVVRLKREVFGVERFKEYRVDQITNWKLIEPNASSLVNSYENAYWFIGGERISFDYYGREIRIGIQLANEEANELLAKIKHYLKSK